MVWIGVYFADDGMKRPSKCHSRCGSDSVRRRTASSSISESTEKSNASVRSWCTGSCARPEEPVRFAARTQPKSHRRMKNQPTKPTPSQECTRCGPKCFVKWAMRNVPNSKKKQGPSLKPRSRRVSERDRYIPNRCPTRKGGLGCKPKHVHRCGPPL